MPVQPPVSPPSVPDLSVPDLSVPNLSVPDLSVPTVPALPALSTVGRVWFALGIQSFGGGVATLALIRRAVIDEHRWMTEEEFARDWALVQVAPGINLVALTILIGRRLAGWQGILTCLAGLLLPSVAITLLLTASYAQVQHNPLVQAALRGIIPATVGIGLVTAVQMAHAPLATARKEGIPSQIVAWALLTGSALLALRMQGNIAPILAGAAILGALAQFWIFSSGQSNRAVSPAREEKR